MTTISLTDIEGLDVVAVADATSIGTVDNLVLDRAGRSVVRMRVGGSKRSPEMIDWSDVTAVGDDAVTVQDPDDIHPSSDDADDLYVRGEVRLLGARVLDDRGFERGQVTDLHFEDDSGAVVAFLTDHGRVPVERVHSLGKHALVVHADD